MLDHTGHRLGRPKTHGRVPKHLYLVWKSLRERCRSPENQAYHNYGGRGITVCEEWQSYEAFRDWALANGWRRGLHINRINNDGDYHPDNCNLVTPKQNSNNGRHNRRLTWQGRTLNLTQWAAETGLNYRTLHYRLKHGWTVEQTLGTPPGPGGREPR